MEVIEHHRRGTSESPGRGRGVSNPWLRHLERLLDHPAVAIAIMVGAVTITALAWLSACEFAASDARLRFERRSDEIHRSIAARMAAYEVALRGTSALLTANPATSRAEFQRYVTAADTARHLPGVQAVGVARLLGNDDVAPLERSVRAEGYPDFSVRPPGGDGLQRSAILYIEPLAGRNLRAFGFDMLTEPVRREAMLRARDGGQATLSGVVTLMQETGEDEQKGLLLYLPVFQPPPVTEGDAPGLRRHWGWVYAAFRVHDLMRGIVGGEAPDIAFALHDGQDAAAFFDSDATPPAAEDGAQTLERPLTVAGRTWRVRYRDRSSATGQTTRGANLVAALGIAIDLLLVWSLASSMRRRAQAERSAARQGDEARTRLAWLTAVSGLSPDAILVFTRNDDGEYRLVFTNPAFSDWFGLHPEDLEGLSEAAVGEWLDGLAADGHRQPLLAAREATVTLAGPPVRVLRRGMREDSRQRVYYYRDVTRETEVERLKNEFLTTAAHELRTPLASVYGFSELLVNNQVDAPRVARTVGIIHRQAGVLNHLVNELLDLARIDSRGDGDFQRERLDLRHVAELAAESMLRADAVPRVQLQLGDEPRWALVDATKTRQALVNVLSNALKYSPAELPVTLRLAPDVRQGRDGVAVIVRDQGIGMTPEQCARAFERFYRADPSGHILGAGLGLAIVKNIVELQQGEVELQSAEGQGTTVTLWWPSAPQAANDAAVVDDGGDAARSATAARAAVPA